MAEQPPLTADIAIERTGDYRHVVGDQAACIFLGADFDLCFLASSPRPMVQRITNDASDALLQVEARFVETVRVRLNGNGLQTTLLSMLTSLLQNPAIDIDEVQRNVQGIIDTARGEKAS